MAQVSRPYQIALGMLVLFALVWAVALRPHSAAETPAPATPTTTTPAPSSSSQSAAAKGSTNAKGSGSIYHGSAPGVQGLTRALAKAHGAVATSEQNAKQLAERSARASSTAPSSTTSSSSSTTSNTTAASKPSSTSSSAKHSVSKQQAAKTKSSAVSVARQGRVERALSEGKVAVILFWSPKGADDVSVRSELRHLERAGLKSKRRFAAFEAGAKEVASFGSITRGVQVYSTPTLLIVGKSGKTTVLTGLTDAYSLEQAIQETAHS
ncbi:MAG: hypothetical protein ACYDHN_11445 [Solirubrobacteraceae bacterium]